MSERQINLKYRTLLNITVAVWATVMFLFLPACGGKKQDMEAAVSESDSLPDMSTLGVTSLVSDSGLIRYKVIAEEWLVYANRKPSFWAFEKGIYLEKFDTLFNIDASIKADTAYYYEPSKTWELKGNVQIQNQQGDKFNTEQMFWDQRDERIYSEKFIRIEQVDKVLTGIGFTSNQNMTEYQINNPQGVFSVEETAPADSTANK